MVNTHAKVNGNYFTYIIQVLLYVTHAIIGMAMGVKTFLHYLYRFPPVNTTTVPPPSPCHLRLGLCSKLIEDVAEKIMEQGLSLHLVPGEDLAAITSVLA